MISGGRDKKVKGCIGGFFFFLLYNSFLRFHLQETQQHNYISPILLLHSVFQTLPQSNLLFFQFLPQNFQETKAFKFKKKKSKPLIYI